MLRARGPVLSRATVRRANRPWRGLKQGYESSCQGALVVLATASGCRSVVSQSLFSRKKQYTTTRPGWQRELRNAHQGL